MNFLPKHLFIFIPIFACLFSCSIEKRLYNNGYHLEWKHRLSSDLKNEKTTQSDFSETQNDLAAVETEPIFIKTSVNLETNNDPLCDSIKLKNGETKFGVVQEVGINTITYKNCDGSGPNYIIEKTTVKSIKYSNGKEDLFSDVKVPVQETKSKEISETKQVEGFGVAGFLLSIVGFFFAGIPLGIVGVVFGVISIGRSTSHPSKYSGKAFGVLSLIIGLVVLILTIALLV